MANIAVTKSKTNDAPAVALISEIEQQMEQVRRRAFELFETRGQQVGHDLDDWIKAEHDVMGWPAAELIEQNGEFKLEMTLPGYDPAEVEVAATPSEIFVHAEPRKKKADNGHVIWTEFGSDSVYRRFPLPQEIDVNKTKATLDHGLLKIIAGKV